MFSAFFILFIGRCNYYRDKRRWEEGKRERGEIERERKKDKRCSEALSWLRRISHSLVG